MLRHAKLTCAILRTQLCQMVTKIGGAISKAAGLEDKLVGMRLGLKLRRPNMEC